MDGESGGGPRGGGGGNDATLPRDDTEADRCLRDASFPALTGLFGGGGGGMKSALLDIAPGIGAIEARRGGGGGTPDACCDADGEFC